VNSAQGAVVALTLVAALAIDAGCSKSGDKPGPDAAASASAAPRPFETVVPGDEEIRPVYPADAGPPDPIAQRLCDAIHELPAKRSAECCKTTPGFRATSECVRTLSFSLASKAVTLAPEAVDACIAAITKAHEGCGWVGPRAPGAPIECQGIVKGTLKQGEKCRSSHECAEALNCFNVGATRMGVCAPPRPSRYACKTATDPLGGYLSDDTIDAAHPECVGYCITHVCADTKPVGGACKVAAECGPNHACVGGKCLGTPLPNRGEPCPGGECVKGAACIDGKCGEPRAEGEACGRDLECRGLCDKPDAGAKTDAGASGKCVKRCEGTLPPKR